MRGRGGEGGEGRGREGRGGEGRGVEGQGGVEGRDKMTLRIEQTPSHSVTLTRD